MAVGLQNRGRDGALHSAAVWAAGSGFVNGFAAGFAEVHDGWVSVKLRLSVGWRCFLARLRPAAEKLRSKINDAGKLRVRLALLGAWNQSCAGLTGRVKQRV